MALHIFTHKTNLSNQILVKGFFFILKDIHAKGRVAK